jgi:MOSC domain-containing protein
MAKTTNIVPIVMRTIFGLPVSNLAMMDEKSPDGVRESADLRCQEPAKGRPEEARRRRSFGRAWREPTGNPSSTWSNAGPEPEILHGLIPVPIDRRGWRTDFFAAGDPRTQVGRVVALMTAPNGSADARAHTSITARPGGIDGDRYQDGTGTFSTDPRRVGQDITLIEAEALDELEARGVSIAPEEARRNVVTRGIDLDALIGKHFRVGGVRCLGQRRAEPCAHLERLTPGTLRNLVHRGGVRADILDTGTISVGDEIREL